MARTLPHKSSAGALPLHRQVSEALVRDIRAGNLADGTRLKPERAMAQEWDISVGTLRQALKHLEDLGLLERVHGSGNYIRFADGQDSIPNLYSLFRLELLAGGGLPTAQVLSAGRVPKPEALRRLGSSKWAFRIQRLRHLDKVPAAVEEIWLDGDRAKGLRRDQLSEALYHLYETKLRMKIAHVEDQVSVGFPPEWRPANFGPAGQAWGLVERWSFDQDGHAVEYSTNWFNPREVRYKMRLNAPHNKRLKQC